MDGHKQYFCRACGYCLNGSLDVCRCPECGRVFDPNDPATYSSSSRSLLVGKLIRRGAALSVVVALLVFFAPRGCKTGTLRFTCTRCGLDQRFERNELTAPDWLASRRFRYPGWTSEFLDREGNVTGCSHFFKVALATDRVQARGAQVVGGRFGFIAMKENGREEQLDAIPSNASTILESYMSPDNCGVSFFSSTNGP